MIRRSERLAVQRRLQLRALIGGSVLFLGLWLLLPFIRFATIGGTFVDRIVDEVQGIKREKPAEKTKPEQPHVRPSEKPRLQRTLTARFSTRALPSNTRTTLQEVSSHAGMGQMQSLGTPSRIVSSAPEGGRRGAASLLSGGGRRMVGSESGSIALGGGGGSGTSRMEIGGGIGSGSGRRVGDGNGGGGAGRLELGGGGGTPGVIGGGADGGSTRISIPEAELAKPPPPVNKASIIDWIQKNQKDIPDVLTKPENLDQRRGDVSTWVSFKGSDNRTYLLYLVGRRSQPPQVNIFLTSGSEGTLLQDEGGRGQSSVFKRGTVIGSGMSIAVNLTQLPAGDTRANRMMAIFNAWWSRTQANGE